MLTSSPRIETLSNHYEDMDTLMEQPNGFDDMEAEQGNEDTVDHVTGVKGQ